MSKDSARILIARAMVGNSKGKILVLRRSSTDQRAGYWELPGGAADRGETLEQAARRELKEETGLDIKDLEFVRTSTYEYNGQPRLSGLFKCEVAGTLVHISPEHDKYDWVDKQSFKSKKMDEYYSNFFDEIFTTKNSKSSIKSQSIPTSKLNKLIIYADGGSRGNPGPSAGGFVIMTEQLEIIEEGGEYLGLTTNNQAEYQAVKFALESALRLGAKEVEFRLDSLLVVNQLLGKYKVKSRDLWPVHQAIKNLSDELQKVKYIHVPREQNHLADAKVNEILDSH